MPAAVAEPQQFVSTPDTGEIWLARRSALRLIKRPTRQTRDAEGNPAETIYGQTLEFTEGVFRLPAEGPVRLAYGVECEAQELRAWLAAHPMKDDREEGFWRVDAVAPPVSSEELHKLMELATNLDLEGLREFLAQEQAGWDREQLTSTAAGAIERLAAAHAAYEAEAKAAAKGQK